MADRRCRFARLPLTVLILATPCAARAGDPLTGAGPTAEEWVVTVGGSVSYGPSYEGARTAAPFFMPSFDLRSASEPATFGAADDSFGFGMMDFAGARFGVLAGIREARPNGVLPAVPGYSTALEGGAFAEFWPLEGVLRTRIELLQALAADGGLTANLSADVVQKAGDFTWAAGPRLSLANSAYMQTAFGISPAAAVLNGHVAPYDADAGVKSVGVTTSLSYDWTKDWSTTVYGSYQRLTGSAAASPIVTQAGTPNQLTVGLGFEHSFSFGN